MAAGQGVRRLSFALANLRVLECASEVSGPFCGKLLAALGADVLKVERPLTGDPSRRLGPFYHDEPSDETSALFLYLNTNKRSVTLSLDTPTGRDLLQRLAERVDVLIEDARPGAWDALGLSHDALMARDPRLVHVSVTPFGLSGPYRDYKAYELNSFHMGSDGWLTPAGLAHQQFPDREVLKPGAHVADHFVGLNAAVAVMGALFARKLTGRGQLVEVSKQDSHLTLCREHLLWFAHDNYLETKDTRTFAFGGCIPCRDGYVELVVLREHQWQALMQLMGQPVWAGEPRFKDMATRAEHADEVNQRIFDWAKDREADATFRDGMALGLPISVFYSPRQVVESRHERERGYFVPTEHPAIGAFRMPDGPHKLSATPWSLRRPAPLLGQHNREVYCDELGLPPTELGTLRRAGVV